MSQTNTIAVEELRVGMFVQLEGGWLSHPFAVSAFKLTSRDQIDTLLGLGLRRVVWLPDRSDAPPADEPAAAEPGASGAGESTAKLDAPATSLLAGMLEKQRAAAQRCEAERSQAEERLKALMAVAVARPKEAGEASLDLTRSMLDSMLDEAEVGIRLVGAGADRDVAHGLNVSIISLLMGRILGMSEAELLDVGVGALLHDIGKQALPAQHRHVAEGQSAQELQAYKDHVGQGVALGLRMGLSPEALTVLAQHHEHADGGGFPKQLAGEQISLAARVVSTVNRYDGLCNPRSGAPGLTPHEAVATLFAQHRKRFDSTVLNAFIRMMGVYPAGSLVQLTDDRYALVVGANSSRPLKPRVMVFDPAVSRSRALLLNLEQVPDLGIRRSLTAQKLPADALHYLDPRPRVSYYFEPLPDEPLRRMAVS